MKDTIVAQATPIGRGGVGIYGFPADLLARSQKRC